MLCLFEPSGIKIQNYLEPSEFLDHLNFSIWIKDLFLTIFHRVELF